MDSVTCSIDGCESEVIARGWCRRHYYRWHRTGDPLKVFTQKPWAERFRDNVDATGGPDACWPWLGKKSPDNGYGMFSRVRQTTTIAHRIAYELATGTWPGKKEVDHTCHNRICVNPAHLRAVTPKQNKENFQGAQRNSKSGVRGVIWVKGKWSATVQHHGRKHQVGRFATIEEAGAAVRAKRLELFTHNDVDRLASPG